MSIFTSSSTNRRRGCARVSKSPETPLPRTRDKHSSWSGQDRDLHAVRLDGETLPASRFRHDDDGLHLFAVADRFLLETDVAIHPDRNRDLMGESALDHFWTVYKAMREDERRINEKQTHPLMSLHPLPYATNVGTINGGLWSSSVMDSLEAQVRVGVSLDETINQAEERFRSTIAEFTRDDPWLSQNPPDIQRLASGFGSAMSGWVRLAGIPTVIYGPGEIELAHGPKESVSLEATYRTAHAGYRPKGKVSAAAPPPPATVSRGVTALERSNQIASSNWFVSDAWK